MMKSYKTIIFLFISLLVCHLLSCSTFKLGIPMSNIPKDAPDEVRRQITELYSFRAKRRLNAIMRLRNMGEEAKASVPFLIEMLDDDTLLRNHRNFIKGIDSYMSSEAALTLGIISDPRAVESLIKEIKDKDEIDREFKAGALSKMGNHAVEPLIRLLNDDDFLTRMYAARILGGTVDYRSVEPLIKALSDEYFSVRLEAVKSLGRIKDTRAVEPLIAMLDDRYEAIRKNAAWALGEIGDPYALESLLLKLDYNGSLVDNSIVMALKKFGVDAAEPLIIIIERERYQKAAGWRLKENAIKLLGKLCTPISLPAIEKRSHTQKVRAVSIPPIMNALKDKNKEVRMQAVWTLGSIKAAEAVEPLIILLKDEDSDFRKGAALALGKINSMRAVEPLIEALNDENGMVRDNAMWALGRITGENFRYDVDEWLEWLVGQKLKK